jgi:hypothetical protein
MSMPISFRRVFALTTLVLVVRPRAATPLPSSDARHFLERQRAERAILVSDRGPSAIRWTSPSKARRRSLYARGSTPGRGLRRPGSAGSARQRDGCGVTYATFSTDTTESRNRAQRWLFSWRRDDITMNFHYQVVPGRIKTAPAQFFWFCICQALPAPVGPRSSLRRATTGAERHSNNITAPLAA